MRGGCCHSSCPQSRAGLVVAWPPCPGCHSVPVPVTGRAGCADGVAPWDPDRVPESHRDPNPPCWHPAQLAPCPPHERAVSPAHLHALCRERGIHSVGGCPAPRRGTPTPRAARAGDAASPLTAATGTSQALAFNVHEERGGGQGRPVLGEQVDVAIPWGQSRAERGARGRSPPKAQQRGAGAHPPSRMLARGRVNCPTKSLQEVLSWSSTTKRTSASSGACSWKLSVSSQRGLKPAALSQGGHGHHGHRPPRARDRLVTPPPRSPQNWVWVFGGLGVTPGWGVGGVREWGRHWGWYAGVYWKEWGSYWGILEGMGFMLGCTGWNGITMGAGWRVLEGMMVTLGLG